MTNNKHFNKVLNGQKLGSEYWIQPEPKLYTQVTIDVSKWFTELKSLGPKYQLYRAPKGGLTYNNQFYKGGQFLPLSHPKTVYLKTAKFCGILNKSINRASKILFVVDTVYDVLKAQTFAEKLIAAFSKATPYVITTLVSGAIVGSSIPTLCIGSVGACVYYIGCGMFCYYTEQMLKNTLSNWILPKTEKQEEIELEKIENDPNNSNSILTRPLIDFHYYIVKPKPIITVKKKFDEFVFYFLDNYPQTFYYMLTRENKNLKGFSLILASDKINKYISTNLSKLSQNWNTTITIDPMLITHLLEKITKKDITTFFFGNKYEAPFFYPCPQCKKFQTLDFVINTGFIFANYTPIIKCHQCSKVIVKGQQTKSSQGSNKFMMEWINEQYKNNFEKWYLSTTKKIHKIGENDFLNCLYKVSRTINNLSDDSFRFYFLSLYLSLLVTKLAPTTLYDIFFYLCPNNQNFLPDEEETLKKYIQDGNVTYVLEFLSFNLLENKQEIYQFLLDLIQKTQNKELLFKLEDIKEIFDSYYFSTPNFDSKNHYFIKAKHSNRNLCVINNELYQNPINILSNYNKSQIWFFEYQKNNNNNNKMECNIRSALTGKYLFYQYNTLILQDMKPNNSQFKLELFKKDQYLIRLLENNKLVITGNQSKNYFKLMLKDSKINLNQNQSENQLWTLVEESSSSYRLKMVNKDLYITEDIEKSELYQDLIINQQQYNNIYNYDLSQYSFHLERQNKSSDYYFIYSNFKQLVLTTKGNRDLIFKVKQKTDNEKQLFSLKKMNDSFYYIVSKKTGKACDVKHRSKDKARVTQFRLKTDDINNQLFQFEENIFN
ncbi:hypothetical protein M0812_19777 [Anaeramoeba flamelloides]|uniref:Ricin B lectin domain-containing protein n=1 Tax=Anaeramoeba flamelloides TaxID=1746091 RepID=A0AAV7Z048_9EUKA|nr:hypothetical protein M0812_19777 [Anaeramoeba flamelloides]